MLAGSGYCVGLRRLRFVFGLDNGDVHVTRGQTGPIYHADLSLKQNQLKNYMGFWTKGSGGISLGSEALEVEKGQGCRVKA